MSAFLSNNMGTIFTGIGLLVVVTAIILNIYWGKKKNPAGKCAGCSCGCGMIKS